MYSTIPGIGSPGQLDPLGVPGAGAGGRDHHVPPAKSVELAPPPVQHGPGAVDVPVKHLAIGQLGPGLALAAPNSEQKSCRNFIVAEGATWVENLSNGKIEQTKNLILLMLKEPIGKYPTQCTSPASLVNVVSGGDPAAHYESAISVQANDGGHLVKVIRPD